MVLDNVQQLRTLINRIRADSNQSTKPLTMKLNGTLDAAVNGGVSKFEVFFTHDYLEQNPKCKQSVPKLKMLMEELASVVGIVCRQSLGVGSLWDTSISILSTLTVIMLLLESVILVLYIKCSHSES